MTDIRRGREAIALLSGQACEGEANVVCPACQSNHTHVFRLATQVGIYGDEANAAREGSTLNDVASERRSVVEIVFSCEHCPHHFALVLEQHQGHHHVVIYEDVPNFTDWPG